MQSRAKTVQDYLKELPSDRREIIAAVRAAILAHLPKGYEECMSYGMIGYVVPHTLYSKGYPCNPKLPLPFINLGSQKNYMVLHLMGCYCDPTLKTSLENAWKAAGKKFDMGGGCVRFKKLDEVPLDAFGKFVKSLPVSLYVQRIERAFARRKEAAPPRKTSKVRAAKAKPAV